MPRELSGDTSAHTVIIVGAGPVGLLAALQLARLGIRVTLVEQDNRVSAGSRALALSYRSLEILGRLGVADRFLARGLPWASGRAFYRDTEISNFTLAQSVDAQYPSLLNLQQPHIERYLVEACLDSGLVDIRWSTEFVDVQQAAAGTTLTLRSPHGQYQATTDWLIAADGARSKVRESLGLRLEGTTYNNMFVIVDVRMASDRPTERLCWFDPPAFPSSTVLLHKQPDDLWRIDFQVPATLDSELATSRDYVEPKLRAHFDWMQESSPWEIEWISLYRAHARRLAHFRHGRIVFVGDAAHLLPIFGVRGMNSGFADVENLIWKLAAVIERRASETLLDSYDVEQCDAFDQNRQFAHLSTLFMTPGTRGSRLVRDAALDLALSSVDFRALADPRYSTPVHHREGPLMCADDPHESWRGGLASGQLVPNRKVRSPDGREAFLNDIAGRGWLLLGFDLTMDSPQLPASISMLDLASASELGESLDAQPGTVYVLRPDRHILARSRTADVWRLSESIDRVLRGVEPRAHI